MKSLLIGTCLVLSFSVAKANYMSFASDVPSDQKKLLNSDLDLLKSVSFTDESNEAVNIFKTPINGTNLELWLAQRSKIIVPESFELSESTIKVLDRNYAFPNFEMPELKAGKSTVPGGSVKTVMSNIGSALYLISKKSSALLGVEVNGVGKIAGTTPRIGLIKIGDGMFMPLMRKSGGTDFQSYANSLSRLSVFFHESRHSDGNGKSLGFVHAICPEGHNYAGYNACDENLNGPYTIGAIFTKSTVNNCEKCSEGEKEALRNQYADSFNRVIPEVEVPVDSAIASAQATIRETCAELVRLKIDISTMDSCKNMNGAPKDSNKIKSISLDETPEIGPAFGGSW